MRSVFLRAKNPFFALALTAALEAGIVWLTGDNSNCFFHNTISGNILLWMVRILTFFTFLVLLTILLSPAYSTVKDRMMEKQEKEAGKPKAKVRFINDQPKATTEDIN